MKGDSIRGVVGGGVVVVCCKYDDYLEFLITLI
jgi:hypothetical protein